MGMVPPASPAPRYRSRPLPVLQCWVLCPGCLSHPWVSIPITRHWSWRDTKAGGLRLPCHGHSRSVDTVAGAGPAASSFVEAWLVVAMIFVCVGEVAARCWGLGRGSEGALLGELASLLGSLFSFAPLLSAGVCLGHVYELSMEGG